MIKKNPDDKLTAILGSGMRLAWQIRDIHDYSEIQNDNLVLVENNYERRISTFASVLYTVSMARRTLTS
jgi:hypothetical protein